MARPQARLGDISSHGGVIVTGALRTVVNGRPAARLGDCAALEGATLALGAHTLAVGRGTGRALRPCATLHAQRVTSATLDARDFQDEVAAALSALGVASPFISGQARSGQAGDRAIAGFALSVHQLDAEGSLRLQAHGVGGDRRLGWGIFVPAKTITTAD